MFYHGIQEFPDKWSHRSDEWNRYCDELWEAASYPEPLGQSQSVTNSVTTGEQDKEEDDGQEQG